MKHTILTAILVTILALCLTACGCEHEWKEATCTEAKTCSLCQKTEGESLGHQWKTATCTTPKTCETCNKTEGTAMGHDYQEGTGVDYVSALSITTQTCSRCRDIQTATKTLTTLHDGEYFLMSPAEFTDRLANTMVALVEEFRADGVDFRSEYLCFADRAPTEPALMIYLTRRTDGDDDTITSIGYLYPIKYDNYAMLDIHMDNRGDMLCIRGPVLEEDASFVMLSLVKALNPTADNTEAWNLYEKWAQTGYTKAGGLVYTWLPDETPKYVRLAIYIG